MMGTSRSRATLSLLVLVFVVTRALFVFSLADVFFYGEELEKGAVAKALTELAVPYHLLPYHIYEGGGFVVSHLKAVAFALVGENVFAHRLVAACIGVAMLIAGYVMVRRHFGERAALLFGLFFVFAPLSFQKLLLINVGIHGEAMLFLLVIFDRALTIRWSDEVRLRDFVVLGLATGFGAYFNYYIVLVGAFVAPWLLWKKTRVVLGVPGVVGLLTFLVGFSPFLYMLATNGKAVFDIHGSSLVSRRFDLGATFELLASFYEDQSARGLAESVACTVALVFSLVYVLVGAPRSVRERCMPLLAFALFWLVIYATSGFVVRPSSLSYYFVVRLAPGWMLGTLVVSAGLGSALASPRVAVRWAARLQVAVLVGIGMANSFYILGDARPGTMAENTRMLFHAKGYDFANYITRFAPRLEGDDVARLRVVLEFHDPDPAFLRADAASGTLTRPNAPVLDVLGAFEPDVRRDLARGLGGHLTLRFNRNLIACLEFARERSDELRGPLLEAVGRFGRDYRHTPRSIIDEVAGIGVHYPGYAGVEPYVRGAGYRAMRHLVFGPNGGPAYILRPDRVRALADELPEDARELFLEGTDQAMDELCLP